MAHPAELNWQRLPLTGASNVRDLGGYPAGPRQTKWHAFLRAGDLRQLTPEDCEFLYRYGVRTAIDLSPVQDQTDGPRQRCGEGKVAYIHAPLKDADIADFTSEAGIDETAVGAEFAENATALRTVFRTIAQAPEDTAILLHCNAGHDRTGAIAMLLLMLAGVGRTDCIENYTVSALLQKRYEGAAAERDPLDADGIVARGCLVYDFIASQGGAKKYLEERCGVSAPELERVAKRIY